MIFLATFADDHKGLAMVYLGKMATHRAYSEMTTGI